MADVSAQAESSGSQRPDSDLAVLLVTKGLDVGGLERVVTDLAVGLDARGVHTEVAVVCGARDAMVPALERAGVTVHLLGGSDRIGVRGAIELRRLVQRCGTELVHVHGPLPSVLTRLLRRRPRVVTTSHTPWHGLNRLTRLAWWLTARRDAATIAVSAAVQATLPLRLRDNVMVIPHGVDSAAAEHARTRASSTPQTERPNGTPLRAITVASHRDVKNYPGLLDAVADARRRGAPIELTAVGEGPGYERHVELAAELGIGDIVRFAPPSPDVLDMIAAADVLVVASDYEGQPMVVAEALALGVPVIATAVGRVPEMVDPSVGRIVPPGDSAALADALVELAGAPSTLAEMKRAAARHEGLITLDDTIEAHLEMYTNVLGRSLHR